MPVQERGVDRRALASLTDTIGATVKTTRDRIPSRSGGLRFVLGIWSELPREFQNLGLKTGAPRLEKTTMNADSNKDADTVSIADDIERRRKHLRVYDAEGVVSIATQDEATCVEGELLDESCAGIGLAIDAGASIAAGAAVTVDFFGTPVRGIVRYRELLEDGRTRLGVEWTS